MDLLKQGSERLVGDESWRIYSRHDAHAPQYVSADAVIENSMITEGCDIYGTVQNSVLGAGVVVKAGAVVKDSLIFDGAVIEEDAVVNYSIIDTGVVVGKGATVGADKESAAGVAVVGAGVKLEDGSKTADGAMISM